MAEASVEMKARVARADALRDDGKLEDAIAEYQVIVAECPNSPEAHFKLGTAYARRPGAGDAAESCYRRALEIWREYPEANNNLGLMLGGRGQLDEAEQRYRIALAERPDFREAHVNLGWLLHEMGRLDEARYHARRVLVLQPDSSVGYDLLGQVAKSGGRITEATRHSRRAVELNPESAVAWTNLGACLWNQGFHAESEQALRRALEIIPDFLPAWNNLLLMSNYRMVDQAEVVEMHRSFGAVVRRKCGQLAQPASGSSDPERRLRVGFLSGDLRRHSVSYFLHGALERLDRRQFQLYAYFNHRNEDEVTWRLKPYFSKWRSVFGVTDAAAADQIRKDRIDILIDLVGHTATARPLVLGRKPAPVQVHWIGYPNTTGLDTMDYRLTDSWADPEFEDGRYSVEPLWRLPASFLCYTPPDSAPDPAVPPCMNREWITFGSFNSRAKLSGECIELWTRVLCSVPDSRLVLKSYLGADDSDARAELQRCFVDRGIAPERIRVLDKKDSTKDHLSAYGEMDIALDTLPYNGTTTTCEALWMGVPVVTLAGDRHAARVGASLLNNAGLGDLVAASADDFVAIACELASDRVRLKDFRIALRDHLRNSRLLDKAAMGADLGAALRGIWREHCAGLPAQELVGTGELGGGRDLMRLHIGGREARDGWKIFDVEPRDDVDFVGDVTNLDAFADESCVEIYCPHVLQRVPQAQIFEVAVDLHRILAPGGRLYVSVPDLEILGWLFLNPGYREADRFQIMRRMFGGQCSEQDFNRIGLYADLMSTYLRDAGFSSVEHVEGFDLFDDGSNSSFDGHRISLNLIATK